MLALYATMHSEPLWGVYAAGTTRAWSAAYCHEKFIASVVRYVPCGMWAHRVGMRTGYMMRQQAIAAVYAKVLRLNSASIGDVSAGKVHPRTHPRSLLLK